jgi:hypothetical protein
MRGGQNTNTALLKTLQGKKEALVGEGLKGQQGKGKSASGCECGKKM